MDVLCQPLLIVVIFGVVWVIVYSELMTRNQKVIGRSSTDRS